MVVLYTNNLPNGQENVVKYDELSLSCRLWYLELVFISVRYLTPVSLGSILYSVDPLWVGLVNASFNHTGSKHNLTFPLALGPKTKLLHPSDISSKPKRKIICCFCSHSNSSFSGFCSAEASLLSDAWCGWLPSFTHEEYLPSKHPIPEKRSLNPLCNLFVIVSLTLCQLYGCH